MRAQINEQKTARGKMDFKSEAELDAEIQRLDAAVNSGKMRLVEEKRALDEISRYKKAKKNFSQFTNQQKDIDKIKAEIAEIKKSMDNPEQKKLSDRYTEIQTELDAIKAEQDEAFKNLNTLRDQRTELQNKQREQFEAIRKIKDEYFASKRAYKQWESELWAKKKQRAEEQKKQKQKEEKLARAREILTEASEPAYLEEIRRAESLWHFFDPSHEVEKKVIATDSGLRATATRTVDNSAFKGMKAIRKEDRDEDYLPAVKKGKKGKKGHNSSVNSSDKFSCPPAIMEDCAFLAVPVPASQTDVPATINKIKEKLENWRANQQEETEKNIAKAKKEIEKLEAAEEEKNDKNIEAITTKMEESKVVDETAAS